MGPWLRATKQGLWPHQLRLTEQTKCLGWLLYLAPEYHLSALRQQIQQETRIEVALRFRTIHDGRPTNAKHPRPRTKAIHMEVDLNILPEQQNRLERVYSSTAQTFPLGIKMRLIPELGMIVNTDAYENAVQLTNCQARLLAHTITSRIHSTIPDPSKPNLVYQTLQDIALPSGMANSFGKPLFHAISPMATKEGYLVRYLPQYTTQAQAMITQLSDSLLKHTVALVSTAPLGIPSPPPTSTARTPPPRQLVDLDKWLGLQFCLPFGLDSLPSPQLSGASTLLHPCNTLNKPSNHNISRWLAALWQLFQNTAWDRWRYQNGVRYYWREPRYLLPALFSS